MPLLESEILNTAVVVEKGHLQTRADRGVGVQGPFRAPDGLAAQAPRVVPGVVVVAREARPTERMVEAQVGEMVGRRRTAPLEVQVEILQEMGHMALVEEAQTCTAALTRPPEVRVEAG
jgi:hypothetical protein